MSRRVLGGFCDIGGNDSIVVTACLCLCVLVQFKEGKKQITRSHNTRSDIDIYVNAVVEPLLRMKASTGGK